MKLRHSPKFNHSFQECSVIAASNFNQSAFKLRGRILRTQIKKLSWDQIDVILDGMSGQNVYVANLGVKWIPLQFVDAEELRFKPCCHMDSVL